MKNLICHSKKHYDIRVLSMVLVLTMLISTFMPARAMASSAIVTDNCPSDTAIITDSTTAFTQNADHSGWYLAKGTVTITRRVNIRGNINLILDDNCRLIIPEGITVPEGGNSLTIWGNGNNSGALYSGTDTTGQITCSDGLAGIGGDDQNNAGTIIINGGTIVARSNDAAAIGPSMLYNGGPLVINGGIVDAKTNADVSAISGSLFGDAGSFQTQNESHKKKGNSIIYTNSFGDTSSKAQWSGVFLASNIGTCYGSPSINDDLTISSGHSLKIPKGSTLTIGPDATLDISGGHLIVEGTINVLGSFKNNGGKIDGLANIKIASSETDKTSKPSQTTDGNGYYTATTPEVIVLDKVDNPPSDKIVLGMEYLDQFYSRYAIYKELYMAKFNCKKNPSQLDKILSHEQNYGSPLKVRVNATNVSAQDAKVPGSDLEKLTTLLTNKYGKNNYCCHSANKLSISVSNDSKTIAHIPYLEEGLHIRAYCPSAALANVGVCTIKDGKACFLSPDQWQVNKENNTIKIVTKDITTLMIYSHN